MRNAVWIKEAEAVADRESEFLAVHAGQRRHDIHRGVRDQRRMMICQQRPLLLHEMQQAWNLLEIRRYIRVVAAQMNVVELQIDDVLDCAAVQSKLATRGIRRHDAGSQEREQRACGIMSKPVHLNPPRIRCSGARAKRSNSEYAGARNPRNEMLRSKVAVFAVS